MKTELHWSYVPEDYFEESEEFHLHSGVFAVEGGSAVLTLRSPIWPTSADDLLVGEREVRAVFFARQLVVHRTFELGGVRPVHYDEDGTRHLRAITGTGHVEIKGFAIDARTSSGEAVVDSKRDRQESERAFVSSLAPKIAYSAILMRMAASFGNAMADPDNELHHLYEIRDAAVDAFGSRKQVEDKLRLSKHDFEVLGTLANVERLTQGRHRGRGVDRDATETELQDARRVARLIIERYAEWRQPDGEAG
jgi:hypothetical protein